MAEATRKYVPAVIEKVPQTTYVDTVVAPARDEIIVVMTQDEINYLTAILGARNVFQRCSYIKEGQSLWDCFTNLADRQNQRYRELRNLEQKNFDLLRIAGKIG